MPGQAKHVNELIVEIRATFQDLAAYGTVLYGDLGVNASMRAIVEYIDEHGAQSVPTIARAKNVSRQHIQTIVDQLLEARLVEQKENPAHKRSVLIALTRKGRTLYEKIRERDAATTRALAKKLAGADLAGASETLRALRRAINNSQTEGDQE